MHAFRYTRFARRLTLILAVVAMTGLTTARSARGDGLPWIAGFSFDLFMNGGPPDTVRLVVTLQDVSGNFEGFFQRSGVNTPVSGTIVPAVAGSFSSVFQFSSSIVIQNGSSTTTQNSSSTVVSNPPPGASSYRISFREIVSPTGEWRYEAWLQPSGAGATMDGLRYLYRMDVLWVFGLPVPFPSIDGPYPFSATGSLIAQQP